MITTRIATESHAPDWNNGAGDWASREIFGRPGEFDRFCSLTVMRDGTVIAVIILHNWQPEAGVIEISAAGGGGWQSRRVINEVMRLCFDSMGCQMVVMRNSANAPEICANSRRLGFTGTLLPRMRGRNEDEWLFTMTEEEWKSGRIYKPT